MVAPNPIDFDKAFKGFSDIASNPIVFATVLTIFGLYFVGAIWARWRDKKDLEKVILVSVMIFGHDLWPCHMYKFSSDDYLFEKYSKVVTVLSCNNHIG